MDLHIADLLRFALTERASDLHLSAGYPPLVRIDGEVQPLEHAELTASEVRSLLGEAMTEAHGNALDAGQDVDFAFALDDQLRFRVNAFTQSRGLAAVFRVISSRLPTLDELGLPAAVRAFCEADRGLVLVTGASGSGKSTTLAAMIDHLNATVAGHILTLEDPVEFVHGRKRAIVNQREVGRHARSFAGALRSALREDPDVILVGELRDLETIALALTAAETGHLVLATLHTAGAAKSIERIVDVFPAAQQSQARAVLAEALVGIVSQALLKRSGSGRVGAFEVLVGTPAVRTLIREGKTHQIPSLMQTGTRVGMQTMSAAVAALRQRGVIDPEPTPAAPTTCRAESRPRAGEAT